MMESSQDFEEGHSLLHIVIGLFLSSAVAGICLSLMRSDIRKYALTLKRADQRITLQNCFTKIRARQEGHIQLGGISLHRWYSQSRSQDFRALAKELKLHDYPSSGPILFYLNPYPQIHQDKAILSLTKGEPQYGAKWSLFLGSHQIRIKRREASKHSISFNYNFLKIPHVEKYQNHGITLSLKDAGIISYDQKGIYIFSILSGIKRRLCEGHIRLERQGLECTLSAGDKLSLTFSCESSKSDMGLRLETLSALSMAHAL